MKLPQRPQQVVNTTKKILKDEEFKSHHRTSPKVFLRERKLTFCLVMLLIMQKTMKSIQLLLNEVFGQIDLDPATNSAGTTARRHLKHTAFIELIKTSDSGRILSGRELSTLSRVSIIGH